MVERSSQRVHRVRAGWLS